MSLRASIGAGRGRLLQQVLVESGVLTLVATALGLMCAKVMLPFIVRMLTTNENPVYLDTRLDWRVLAFVATLGGLTTVLFGLVPAIRASSASPATAAAAGDRSRTAHPGMANSTLLRERLLAVLSGFFAALGLVLSAVGLYGVLSYAVVRRTREIGIRMTLGAQPAAVVRAVIGRIALAIGLGVVAGLAGGAYFATFVRTLLYEVEPFAAASFVVPVLGLLAVGAIAAFFPARRATRVDPAEALRIE